MTTANDPACTCRIVQRDEWGRATVELDFRIVKCPLCEAARHLANMACLYDSDSQYADEFETAIAEYKAAEAEAKS